jgi:hypothetical protein
MSGVLFKVVYSDVRCELVCDKTDGGREVEVLEAAAPYRVFPIRLVTLISTLLQGRQGSSFNPPSS